MHCSALHWLDECLTATRNTTPVFSECCQSGKVVLPPIGVNPSSHRFRWLLTSTDPEAVEFRKMFRNYNNAFAMSSAVLNQDHTTWGQMGVYSLRHNGELYHLAGSLMPSGSEYNFAQIYILDAEEAIAQRLRHHDDNPLSEVIVRYLESFLRANNHLARVYRHAYERLALQPDASGFRIIAVKPKDRDHRRYNLPAAVEEVALIMPDGQNGVHLSMSLD